MRPELLPEAQEVTPALPVMARVNTARLLPAARLEGPRLARLNGVLDTALLQRLEGGRPMEQTLPETALMAFPHHARRQISMLLTLREPLILPDLMLPRRIRPLLLTSQCLAQPLTSRPLIWLLHTLPRRTRVPPPIRPLFPICKALTEVGGWPVRNFPREMAFSA